MKNHLTTKLFALVGAVLAGALLSAQAAPTHITTAQGKGADSSIRGGDYANRAFGNLDILRVRNTADLRDARKTYLRFDLAGLKDAKTATGAALNLTIAPAEGSSPADKEWTFRVFGLRDATESENWNETTLSWANAPAMVPSSSFQTTEEALPLGTFILKGKGNVGETVSFSSPELLNFVKSDTNGVVTLIVSRVERNEDNSDNVVHIFAAKEHAQLAPPSLTVAFNGENPAVSLPTQANAPQANAPQPVAEVVVEGPKPLPYESHIASVEKADAANPPARGGIVFIGSSSIRLWKTLKEDFPGHNVINRGFGGSQISDSVNFAQRIVTPYEPRMVVFYAGSNDVNAGKSPERVLADYQAFVAKVREKQPNVPIAFIAIAPSPSRWPKIEEVKKANALIEQFSSLVPNLKFVDIFPLMLDEKGQPRPELFVADQLHMNEKGYAIWTTALKPMLPQP